MDDLQSMMRRYFPDGWRGACVAFIQSDDQDARALVARGLCFTGSVRGVYRLMPTLAGDEMLREMDSAAANRKAHPHA